MTSDPICWYSTHQPLRYLLQCSEDRFGSCPVQKAVSVRCSFNNGPKRGEAAFTLRANSRSRRSNSINKCFGTGESWAERSAIGRRLLSSCRKADYLATLLLRRRHPCIMHGLDHGEFEQGSVGRCRARRARRGVRLVYGADFQRRKASPGGSSGGTSKPSASERRSRSEKMGGARRSPRIISSGGILMGCSTTGPCSWSGSVIIGSTDRTNGP